MKSKRQTAVFYLFVFVLLTACGGTICKGKKNVIFHYDPVLKTVDVGGAPTYFKGKNAPWVKKIIVKTEGFIVVTEQKTAGLKKRPCEDDKARLCDKHIISSYYIMQSYIEGEGYKYWENIPKEDWISVSGLRDYPLKKPDLHVKDCRLALFGTLLDAILSIIRA